MKNNLLIITIFLILGISFFIRIWRVTEAPPTVNWDEAAVGYNAYSLFKTGRDEFGKIFPVSLRSFDDYKPALYSWMTVMPIGLFGLNETTARMVSVFSGVVMVFSAVYITCKLTGKIKTGLIAGLFLSFSPWAIHFSRIAFEANLAAGLYWLATASFFGNKKSISLILFIISMYAYHAQRIIALPTFVLLLIVFEGKNIFTKNHVIKYALMTTVLLLPLAYSFWSEPAASRLSSTAIWKLWPFVPTDVNRLIINPVVTIVWQMAGQFMAYFSPTNLFVRGSNEPILRIPSLGLMALEMFPLWVAGLLNLIKKTRINKWLWIVMIITPLPAIITWNWFSVVRTLALYPAFSILAALGFGLLKLPRVLKTGYWGIIGLSAWYTVLTIGIYAPWETYGDFQPGFEKTVPYVLEEAKKYDRVIFDSPHIAPYIFVLFYGQYSPSQYLAEAGINRKNSGTEDYNFGKYEFRKITPEDLNLKDVLLVGPTVRIPDYKIEEYQKDIRGSWRDFPDTLGYTSFRVVSL